MTLRKGDFVAWDMTDGNVMAGEVADAPAPHHGGRVDVRRVDGGSVTIDPARLRPATYGDWLRAMRFYDPRTYNFAEGMEDVVMNEHKRRDQ